jgi:rubrerythrin
MGQLVRLPTLQGEAEYELLKRAGYTLPDSGSSRTCKVCSKPCFILLTWYDGVRIKPKRCLGCVIKFPPQGVTFTYNDYIRRHPWLSSRERYHQWGLMAQTLREDVWTCLHCKSTLRSPKLGIPSSRGCPKGVAERLRRAFWAHNRVPSVRCPLCDERASLLRAPRLMERRPSSKFFPWTCRACFVSS